MSGFWKVGQGPGPENDLYFDSSTKSCPGQCPGRNFI